jgi:general secretion pathway protein C
MRREPAQAQRNLSMPAQHIHLPNTGGWQNRFRDQGARVVSLVLCAMIAIEVARAAMTLFGGSAVTGPQAIAPQASLAQAAVPTNMRALQRPVVDVHKIIAAQLFGSFAADPSTQDPSGAPRTAANLQLAGTLATENPKAGFAIISDTGPAEVYTVGASVGGATLYSVYRDHVILNRNGILETLLLPKLSLGKGRGSTPAVASRSAESGEPKPLDASNARTVADAVRTAASVGPDGRLRGFRLFPNGNREAFDKSGLRGGDLLVAVNGASLQNQDRRTGSEILSSFTTSGSVSVTVERNGERQELTLNAPVESIE